jgi:exosortase
MSAVTAASPEPLPSPARTGGWSPPAKANLVLLGLFWLWLCGELWFEWSLSEQYGYGLFVPFLTGYLLWLRVQDCPTPQPWNGRGIVWGLVGLAALAQYPIAVIFTANADWRLLAWGEALLALMVTVLLLATWGGWPWVRHFLPAFILFLFAVPWPSYLQISLVDDLMSFVATVVTEILNLLGYDAAREGHIIRLPGSFVAVEEACSGVRSIQSTIMAGWLVGEWWRFHLLGRLGAMVWACFIAVLFNLLRTLALAWIDAAAGPAVMSRWHDPAGYLVFGLSFVVVLLGAWLMRPHRRDTPAAGPAAFSTAPGWLPQRGVLAVAMLLAVALPLSIAWYALRAPDVSAQATWKLDLAAVAPQAQVAPADRELKQALYFSTGIQATWVDEAGHDWSLYNLQWKQGRAAQLGGVHSPESCLPAVGWTLAQQGDNLVWSHHGLELVFNTYEFDHGATRLFVFYCQWDPAGYHYYEKTGRYRADRLLDAWLADRKEGKQLLEIAIGHTPSLATATRLMEDFLNHAIVELPPAGK